MGRCPLLVMGSRDRATCMCMNKSTPCICIQMLDCGVGRCISVAMARRPSANTTAAWTSLVRAQHALMDAIEGELKDAGFPPLAWYDVLLELSLAPRGSLRPVELEKRMLLPQYGL